MTHPDRTDVARPRLMRPLWIPGIQYGNETVEQMEAREARLRECESQIAAEEERLWRWMCRPW